MCAIVGEARADGSKVSWALLERARDAMVARGPDDAGLWSNASGNVALGHRRLAVIDLSPAGHQPMHNASGALTIVFNGEIYNFVELRGELASKGHVFRSNSDTEVVLAAYTQWGVDCLSRLNGMFAFAIFDAPLQQMFLARDRAGEKPLFYFVADGTLKFASELKALMIDPAMARRMDPSALDCYLAMGYVPGQRCILQGVNKLPAAHAMRFDLSSGQAKVWRYWSLPEYAPGPHADGAMDDALLDELEELLSTAVRRQMVADVPIGVLLSGGVDSSLVTAMAARATTKLKTFTIRFPGYGAMDETEHARLIARHFSTEHAELEAHAASVDLLPLLARQFDEPIVDSSMIPTYLVSQMVRRHCTVVLGGDGGDELFGGYGHYSRLLWIKERFAHVPQCLRHFLAWTATKSMPVGAKGRNWLQALGVNFESELPLIASYFDASIRQKLFSKSGPQSAGADTILKDLVPHDVDFLQRATRMDFSNYLAQDILVKVDRASMLNSLEVRAPLLDRHLIEFAFGKVPSRLKTTAKDKKILLKRLTARVLPPEFDRKRKQGFSIPLGHWLKAGEFRSFFHDVLLDSHCIYDRRVVQDLFRGQDRGRNNSERLFSLVMLELWRREYSVSW